MVKILEKGERAKGLVRLGLNIVEIGVDDSQGIDIMIKGKIKQIAIFIIPVTSSETIKMFLYSTMFFDFRKLSSATKVAIIPNRTLISPSPSRLKPSENDKIKQDK